MPNSYHYRCDCGAQARQIIWGSLDAPRRVPPGWRDGKSWNAAPVCPDCRRKEKK